MVKRNCHFDKLKAGYLFPEINARKKQFLAQHPHAKIISLGIGDTTEPLTSSVKDALVDISEKLGTREGYVGYGAEQGIEPLRKKIAATFYGGQIAPEEIFVSDGAKCDLGRLQVLFGGDLS